MIDTISFYDNIDESYKEDDDSLDNYKNKKEQNPNLLLSPYLTTASDFKPYGESFEFIINKNIKDFLEITKNNINIGDVKKEKNKNFLCRNPYKKNNEDKFIIKRYRNTSPIFNIKKEIKLGRPKKNSNKQGKHDKFQRDNILRKIKAQLIQNIFNYINISFNCNRNYQNNINQKPINVIQRINSRDTKSISKFDNIKWLNSKISDIFSQKVTTKLVCYDSNYNNRLIKKIIQKNEEKAVIKILKKTVREMWIIYKTDDINNEFPGFNTIKYDIKKFRERNETEDYIKLYSSVCNEFEDIFMKIKARKKN